MPVLAIEAAGCSGGKVASAATVAREQTAEWRLLRGTPTDLRWRARGDKGSIAD
jgi:hypothetical protein